MCCKNQDVRDSTAWPKEPATKERLTAWRETKKKATPPVHTWKQSHGKAFLVGVIYSLSIAHASIQITWDNNQQHTNIHYLHTYFKRISQRQSAKHEKSYFHIKKSHNNFFPFFRIYLVILCVWMCVCGNMLMKPAIVTRCVYCITRRTPLSSFLRAPKTHTRRELYAFFCLLLPKHAYLTGIILPPPPLRSPEIT